MSIYDYTCLVYTDIYVIITSTTVQGVPQQIHRIDLADFFFLLLFLFLYMSSWPLIRYVHVKPPLNYEDTEKWQPKELWCVGMMWAESKLAGWAGDIRDFQECCLFSLVRNQIFTILLENTTNSYLNRHAFTNFESACFSICFFSIAKRYKTAYEEREKKMREKPCPTLSAQCITIQNVTTTAEFDLIRISQHSKDRKKAKEKGSLDIQRKNWVKNKNKNSVKYRSWSGSHFQPVGLLLNFKIAF